MFCALVLPKPYALQGFGLRTCQNLVFYKVLGPGGLQTLCFTAFRAPDLPKPRVLQCLGPRRPKTSVIHSVWSPGASNNFEVVKN